MRDGHVGKLRERRGREVGEMREGEAEESRGNKELGSREGVCLKDLIIVLIGFSFLYFD